MVSAVVSVTAPEMIPRTLSKTWLITSSGVSVTVVTIRRIGAAADTSAVVTSGGHAIGRATAAMAVEVEGGVPPLPKSILLVDAGVEAPGAAAGGSVRTAGGAVPRPEMLEECLGVNKTGTSLDPRVRLGTAGSAPNPWSEELDES
jgi:hypothetical protein